MSMLDPEVNLLTVIALVAMLPVLLSLLLYSINMIRRWRRIFALFQSPTNET
jgi:hypothetical protein